MNIQFSYKNVSARDKSFLNDYIDKKVDRIKTLVKGEDYQNAFFEVRVEKFAKKEAFKVELYFSFPGKDFKSSEDDHTVIEAFDLALDKLIIQLRKYREGLKKN